MPRLHLHLEQRATPFQTAQQPCGAGNDGYAVVSALNHWQEGDCGVDP
jgi:hypothetical protein